MKASGGSGNILLAAAVADVVLLVGCWYTCVLMDVTCYHFHFLTITQRE